jgi:hypothetical protein
MARVVVRAGVRVINRRVLGRGRVMLELGLMSGLRLGLGLRLGSKSSTMNILNKLKPIG